VSEVAARYHHEFLTYWRDLGISYDLYTTTTTDNHREIVQDEFMMLLDKGYRVCGMVRRSSTENFQRIEHLRDRLLLLQGDLLDQTSIASVLDQAESSTTLPFSATGTPATYEVAGRQFVIVPAGGGKDGGPSGGLYVAFALPR